MADIIITPLGNTVSVADFVPVLKSNAIYFGSAFSEQFPTVQIAQIYYKQVMAQLNLQTASTNKIFDFSGPVITGMSPVPFIFDNTGVTGVNLTGFNFRLNNSSFLHIEDAAGGTDSDGFVFSCVLVDSMNLQATWVSNGNGLTNVAMSLYLNNGQTTAGSLSNIIPATYALVGGAATITNVFI